MYTKKITTEEKQQIKINDLPQLKKKKEQQKRRYKNGPLQIHEAKMWNHLGDTNGANKPIHEYK